MDHVSTNVYVTVTCEFLVVKWDWPNNEDEKSKWFFFIGRKHVIVFTCTKTEKSNIDRYIYQKHI